MIRYVLPGTRPLKCVCGWCRTCRARRRKQESRGMGVTADWRLWSETYRYRYFQSVARDMLGPDANLQCSLRVRRG